MNKITRVTLSNRSRARFLLSCGPGEIITACYRLSMAHRQVTDPTTKTAVAGEATTMAARRELPLDRETLVELIEEGQRNRAAFEAAAGATRVITSDDLKFRCR